MNEMIDSFADRGECDFHEEFAVPLPCTVFLQLLGLPLEDLDKFLEWKDGVIRPEGDTGFARRHETSAGVAQQIYDYFDRAIDDHIASPRDDVLSAMIAANVQSEGGPLSRQELLDICFLFLIAGLDTVTDSLDCFFVYLARHPEHRHQLVEQPDILPHAIEECCGGRLRCPASPGSRRRTSRWRMPISKGERVSRCRAATRPAEFPDPDVVDFDRNSTVTGRSAADCTAAWIPPGPDGAAGGVARIRPAHPG